MTKKAFWSKSTVAVIGGGSWGTVLANLAAQNAGQVRVLVRSEDQARAINSTRANPNYLPELALSERVKAFDVADRVFEGGVGMIVWAIPSSHTREVARSLSQWITGAELLIHVTKGVEPGSLKRISQVLKEELPLPRIGVLSGPNLAGEIAKGQPAATVVASPFQEVIEAGQAVFSGDGFRVRGASDMVGVEWAGTLKNIFAIASGALEAMGLGYNARAMLLSAGLAEMVRWGRRMGAQQETFLGLAGMGDLLATCSSPQSRNYRVGAALAAGKPINEVLAELESAAEGVGTARNVWAFAKEQGIRMPITQGVVELIEGRIEGPDFVRFVCDSAAPVYH